MFPGPDEVMLGPPSRLGIAMVDITMMIACDRAAPSSGGALLLLLVLWDAAQSSAILL